MIDGQHNPPANIWNYNIHEAQKYLSVTNHMTGPNPLLVNKDWYDSLPSDLQRTFAEVAVEALAFSDKLARKAETELLKKLGDHMEVNLLTPEGLATFQKAVVPVYKDGVKRETSLLKTLTQHALPPHPAQASSMGIAWSQNWERASPQRITQWTLSS